MPKGEATRRAAIYPLRLRPSTVARILGGVAGVLIIASIAGQVAKYVFGHDYVYGLVRLTYVDEERSLPTAFSVLLLFTAAVLLAVIATLKKQDRDPDLANWRILAFGFLWLAFDEGAAIHELLVRPTRSLLGDGPLGVWYFTWVIPGMAVAAAVALYFVRFVWRLPARTRWAFVVAGSLFVGGAIGVEIIGGWYGGLHGLANLTYGMLAAVEESMEMGGVIVFIHALLEYLADHFRQVRLEFAESESSQPEE